jgi:hypothetical protein
VVPSLRPKRRRSLAGITKVPRFPIRLDSEIDMITLPCQKFRDSGKEVKGSEAEAGALSNEALNLSRRFAPRSLTPVR